MSAPDAGASPAYASAAHAARLIGRSDRIVQLWMREAGHAATWVPGAGYPVPLLCEVCNRQKWPHQYVLMPEHFRVDTDLAEIADDPHPNRTNENDAALAVYGQLDALQQSILATGERQTAMAAELAALRAQVAQLLADNARQWERDEKAAQSRQEGARKAEDALERIERAVRRVPWWRKILGG